MQSGAIDSLGRLWQASGRQGVQLVRVTGVQSGNVYTARPIEFAASGQTQFVGELTLSVTNLAEPAGAAGALPAGADALAIDVEGRWVIFVRQASAAGAVVARVVASLGGAAYTVREQVPASGGWADKTGAADITAWNLAELSLGPGAAVDDGTRVLVTLSTDGAVQPVTRYVFDHPAYAKYLD
jgi:hypothetical protein